ncbi:MAG: aldehyde-activating protein [Rhodospirillales bacterium]|nr:aldehyde-activating protein [Rhodospirillales bacterium]
MSPATLRGGCHCGNITVAFETAIRPQELSPRACDCSFCRKHGAAYVSDPEGGLAITVGDRAQLNEYRQGSQSARFLICRACGVMVAVLFEAEDGLYGAVNATCLENAVALATPQTVSPQKLGAEDKTRRWKKIWTPRVRMSVSGG